MPNTLADKNIRTKRGFNYHYLSLLPEPGKPTLLFLHGFPSTIRDWHHQIDYFSARGYGLIVPDMLGYGGTDKPTDVKYYILNGMSDDVINILDAEGIDKSFAIGHDWSGLLSYLLEG
jgi:soluble epoxide hydrolase/lipid-phosphate phosphatase